MIKKSKERDSTKIPEMMDKGFQPTYKMYVTQPFIDDDNEELQIAECRALVRTYAITENAIVSMGDNKLKCSYCYFGGLAYVLELAADERQEKKVDAVNMLNGIF